MPKSHNSKRSCNDLSHVLYDLHSLAFEQNVARSNRHKEKISQIQKRKQHDRNRMSHCRKLENDKLTCETHHKHKTTDRKKLVNLKISDSCLGIKFKYHHVVYFVYDESPNDQSKTDH